MKKSILLSIAVVVSLLMIQNCGPATLGLLNPVPWLNIETQNKTIALVLGADVKDKYMIPATGYFQGISATDWHQSLKNGFAKGFSTFFKVVDKDPDLSIMLLKTEVYFEKTGQENTITTTASFSASQPNMGTCTSTPTYRCKILYQAELISSKRETLGKAFGTSSSTIFSEGISQLTASSVENMYEQIAQKFFPVK